MPESTNSGIQKLEDGSSYVPASRRADGTTRREIKVRPGYRPPEDVQTYRNRNTEAWKNRGRFGVPGAEEVGTPNDVNGKSKNAKRREAAKKNKAIGEDAEVSFEDENHAITVSMAKASISNQNDMKEQAHRGPEQMPEDSTSLEDIDRQKKIRNLLKKVRAIEELKEKKAKGEKLSAEQLVKMSKEDELLRDLKKLGHHRADSTDSDPSNP